MLDNKNRVMLWNRKINKIELNILGKALVVFLLVGGEKEINFR